MAKKEKNLKLSPKGVAILVVFVVGMIVATYFFTGYMLTGSSAKKYNKGAKYQLDKGQLADGTKFWCTDSGNNCYSETGKRLGTRDQVLKLIVDKMKKDAQKDKERQEKIQKDNTQQDTGNEKYNVGGGNVAK